MLLEHPSASASSTARAAALFTAGMLAFYQRDYDTGHSLHQEGLALRRKLGDRAGIASALFGLGQVEFDGGDVPRARALHEEALQIRRELGDPWQIALSAGNMGLVVQAQGDTVLARQQIEQSVSIRRQLGDYRGTAGALFMLARVVQDNGDHEQARALYRESLDIARRINDRWVVGHLLAGVASLAVAEGRWSLALRLQGATRTASEASESALSPGVRERADYELDRARGALLNEALEGDSGAYHEGVSAVPSALLGTHASARMPLTRREREVASLIARGAAVPF